MVSKIGQIRIPEQTITFQDEAEWSDNLFINQAVTKMSIYAMPGTKFKIAQTDASFVIGSTGLFSIELPDRYITELYLSKESYELIPYNHFIIIDYIYFAKEENQ